MSLRYYLTTMAIGTAACWIAWYIVILSIDPNSAGFFGISLFYISFFLALVGTFSLAGFFIKFLLTKNDTLIFRQVKQTFRQSIGFSLLLLTFLGLLHLSLLTWWNSILLFSLFILIEAIFFTNRKYSNKEYV